MSIEITEAEATFRIGNLRIEEMRRLHDARMAKNYRVFVSYSRADEYEARALIEILERRHILHSLDVKDMRWGDHLNEAIPAKVIECSHYLLVVSEASVGSRWCTFEMGIALGSKKTVLLFQTDATPLPPMFAHVLATRDLNAVADYFARDIIPAEIVRGLVEEVVGARCKLSGYARCAPAADGYDSWEWRWLHEVQRAREAGVSQYERAVREHPLSGVLRIDIGNTVSEGPVRLLLHEAGSRDRLAMLTYVDSVNAAVFDHAPEWCTDEVAHRLRADDTGALRPGRSLDWTKASAVFGIEASRDVWESTVKALRHELSPTGRGDVHGSGESGSNVHS